MLYSIDGKMYLSYLKFESIFVLLESLETTYWITLYLRIKLKCQMTEKEHGKNTKYDIL